ncbi:MAG: RNA pseudouridine synthase [Alphaproteobacteria bacterium]|nr:RNA pseudouridine synthase [Alphaproteobacteria bacterium]
MTPDQILARLLFRDGLVLILDKPAGLPVHAGPGGGENLEQNFHHLRFGLPHPPALAHRLDRDTSGCLVLGRHRKALSRLGKLFQSGRVEKTYWAVTEGIPAESEGRIDLALAKETPKSGWKMIVDREKGQAAVTDYRVLGTGNGRAWIECHPRTGRTHQIRVHLAQLGCPVLGDPVYGKGGHALHLHSRAVGLPLYPSRAPIVAEAPIPAHMQEALGDCGWRGENGGDA